MLRLLTNVMVALLIAFWIGAIAIFSIQNITTVAVKFIFWESIKLPVGVLLSFCVAGGFLLGSFLPFLFKPSQSKRKRRLI